MKNGNTITHRLPVRNRASMGGHTALSVLSRPPSPPCWAGMLKGVRSSSDLTGEVPAGWENHIWVWCVWGA